MPYIVRLCLYWLVVAALVVAIAVWLAPFGLHVNLLFAFSAAYAWIILGRWIFNRPDGL